MPYYEFDTDAFYGDPSPENILKNLSVPDQEVYFTVKKEGRVMYNLLTVKIGNSWRIKELVKIGDV